jgi:hypothetical protein
MFYYLYEIKNIVNNKIYVGVHQTKDINDGYMGSGTVINKAYEKYGKDMFVKTILEYFDSRDAMINREKEIVNEDFLSRDDTYNLRRGGTGGFDYINKNGLNINHVPRSDDFKKNLSERMKKDNPSKRPGAKERMSAATKKIMECGTHPFLNSEKQRELSNRLRKGGRTKSEVSKETASRMVEDGTHSFLKMNANKITCEHCGKVSSYPNYKRWHGEKCREGHREWNEDLFA